MITMIIKFIIIINREAVNKQNRNSIAVLLNESPGLIDNTCGKLQQLREQPTTFDTIIYILPSVSSHEPPMAF